MIQFQYERASTAKTAVSALANNTNAKFIAGGTNLIDLMKRNITAPTKLVDINTIPLKNIEQQTGKITIGALALNSQVKLCSAQQPVEPGVHSGSRYRARRPSATTAVDADGRCGSHGAERGPGLRRPSGR